MPPAMPTSVFPFSRSPKLSLVVAMNHYQEEEIWQRVGKDPSGQPFNSLLQLEIEQGKPRNPFINAGRWWSAICCKAD
jgi:glutaminase